MAGYGIIANPDGTVTRVPVPTVAPDSEFMNGVASKDVTIALSTGVWARMFLPQVQPPNQRLPVLLYFHGGGFVMMSVANKPYHKFLHKLCKEAHVIVVAVEYRLAPEHRIPAAHDDAFTSLKWLHAQAALQSESLGEPWLGTFADFSRTFLMGDSSGGNIVHNLSIRLSVSQEDIAPLQIQGQVIVQPFFGGQVRTTSELLLANDEQVPLAGTDWLWRTCLPHGADRDHPLANPFGHNSPDLSKLSLPPTIIMVASGDPMQDRQLQLFVKLKESGVEVRLLKYEGSHGFQLRQEPSSGAFVRDVVAFLSSSRSSNL